MELQKVLEMRKSIRKYNDQPVAKEDIETILEAANLAPSWKNSQVTRYRVIMNPDMLEKIRLTLPVFNQENAKDAPVLIVSSIVLNRSGYKRNGEAENEIGNGWGCYDCGMHDMSLLLKATEMGLSTLVMGIRDAKKIKDLLNIDEKEAVMSVIALGYSDFDPERPVRKDVNSITKFY